MGQGVGGTSDGKGVMFLELTTGGSLSVKEYHNPRSGPSTMHPSTFSGALKYDTPIHSKHAQRQTTQSIDSQGKTSQPSRSLSTAFSNSRLPRHCATHALAYLSYVQLAEGSVAPTLRFYQCTTAQYVAEDGWSNMHQRAPGNETFESSINWAEVTCL